MNKKKTILIACMVLLNGFVMAQKDTVRTFYFEINVGTLGSFGPSESQAELSGDVDTLTYDNKKHISPGFKPCAVFEMNAGYQKKHLQLQSTFSYFKQNIGLVQLNSRSERPFLLADMLSIKMSVILQISDYEKWGPYGFKYGLYVSTSFPLSSEMNEQTRAAFLIGNFNPAAQVNWGGDLIFALRLGKKGIYLAGMGSVDFPGVFNCIGKIELAPGSSYTVIRDKIKMYSVKGCVGIGIHI